MKRLFFIISAMAVCLSSFAQGTISVRVQNLVALDEQFNVTFIIEGENAPTDFQWNCGDDFQLVWGPQKGTSTSISIVNGNRTKSSQTTYTYVLMPKRSGTFQLAPATATFKGQSINSRPVSVEVVSNGAQPSGNTGGTAPQPDRQAPSQERTSGGEDLYLRLLLSKGSVMVGEPVTATLKLYQRVNIAGFEDARFPSFNGFWSQELQAPSNIEFRRENVGDQIYNTAVLRSWSLIPQQAGDIRIEPAELVCLVNVRSPRASTGSIFDSFFQDDYQTVRKRVSTGPCTVKVKGLPAGAPESFAGGVGSFRMNVSLTRDSLKAHDAASLKVVVTGKGNTALLDAPKVNFPPDFEVYDVKTTDVSGGKCFEFPFIPRSHGDFAMDPVEYSYFDIDSRKYVTLRSQPLNITVAKGSEAETSLSVPTTGGVIRKDVRDLGSDIRFIKSRNSGVAPAGAFFVGSPLFIVLAVLLIVAAAAFWLVSRKAAARRADVAGTRNRAATKMARKRLSRAGEYLKDNLHTAFYEELHKTLAGFVSDKLSMDIADMSRDNIAAKLAENGVPAGTVDEFIGLLDACEYARYSPDAGHEAMNSHYETAVNVISSIDGNMKRKSVSSAAGAAMFVALLLLSPGMRASDKVLTDSLWTAGVNAYSEGRWIEAAEIWNAVREAGYESADLYYNIGNAFFKGDDVPRAVLNYEKALRLDPSDADIRFNLEFARSMVQDKIESVPEFFLEEWGRKACWMLRSDVWAILCLVFLGISLALFLLFLLGHTRTARKTGFITGVVVFLLMLLCLDFAFWQRTDYRKSDSAIVMRAVTSVKSSPSGGSTTDLFVLHEGSRVRILDTVGEWSNIELADGRQGWMKCADMEIIR